MGSALAALSGLLIPLLGRAGVTAGTQSFITALITGLPDLFKAGEAAAQGVMSFVESIRAMIDGQRDPTIGEWDALRASIRASREALAAADEAAQAETPPA